MIRLSRETRFALVSQAELAASRSGNSWAGWPSTHRIVPQLRLQMIVAGKPHPITGYLCNIKIIDDVLRQVITRRLIPTAGPQTTAEQLLRQVYREVHAIWPEAIRIPEAQAPNPPPDIESIILHLTPFLRYSIFLDSNQQTMIELTQQFEFSAAHRLHCDQLGDEENRNLFGKCNNPEGHGHNYVVEVSVAGEIDSDAGQVISLHQLESTVKRVVIDRLDHKHLNRDVEYFASVNPSVENIARAIFHWLEEEIQGAQLSRVRVFETPKTWAEYAGETAIPS